MYKHGDTKYEKVEDASYLLKNIGEALQLFDEENLQVHNALQRAALRVAEELEEVIQKEDKS